MVNEKVKNIISELEKAEKENTFVEDGGDFKESVPVKTVRFFQSAFKKQEPCVYVAVRPASPRYCDETYLGILIGDVPIYSLAWYNKETQELSSTYHGNPCIFIPDLMTTVLGAESWWQKLKRPEDLHKITDIDIENVWYVKALKALSEKSG